jgi:precorrin-2/cobalt-factor-2 C20-methyltransferase
MSQGTLYGIGTGPGDPELMTVKAARLIRTSPVVAYFAKRGRPGNAYTTAASQFTSATLELPLYYPATVEISARSTEYAQMMTAFYEEAATTIAAHLTDGRDVAVLCEGDPLLYGSYMYLHDQLADRFKSTVVPGVTGMSGCAAFAGLPMTYGDDVLVVVPGTLDETELEDRLRHADAAVVMKLGRNLEKVRRVLDRLDLATRATYVERGTMEEGIAVPLLEKDESPAPYFSLILVPGRKRRAAPLRPGS